MKTVTLSIAMSLCCCTGTFAQSEATISEERRASPLDSLSDTRSIVLKAGGTWHWVSSSGASDTDVENEHPAIRVVRDFLEARTWKEQLGLVADSANVHPAMESAASFFMGPTSYQTIMDLDDPADSIGSRAEVFVVRENKSGDPIRVPYYVIRTPIGWKVDWTSSMGDNPMSIDAVAAIGTSRPVTMRLYALGLKSSSCQNTGEYISFMLMDKNGVETITELQSSEVGKKISSLLKDGERHRIVAEVRAAPDPCFNNSQRASLVRILTTDTWVYEGE